MELLAPSLKRFSYVRKELTKAQIQKLFIFLFKQKCKRKKFSYTFSYKEAKFYKLKFFLIIYNKAFLFIL